MKRTLAMVLLVVLATVLLGAVAQLPPHGSPETPPYKHVSAYYLKNGPREAGADNIVTDIILNYRGFDTNGEVTVIVTALMAVSALLLGQPGKRQPPAAAAVPSAPSVVVRFIVRALAPLILTFAIYVILNGHITPGGGFQGGTIIAALVIALTMVLGERASTLLLPEKPIRLLQVAAPLTFAAVGLVSLAVSGDYLFFPREQSLRWLTELMLIIIEIGIGVGGAAVFSSVFRLMEGDR